MLLRPDFTFYLKGICVRRYDLTQHNPNAIPMPTAVMDRDSIVGITIHNTNRKPPLYSMGTAEQCVWKTMHQELKDVRVHFYVDEYGAWQTLPLQLAGWHATDGAGNGNRRTIAIECAMSPNNTIEDRLSENNCAKLAACLLIWMNLPKAALFTHTYWLNCRDGIIGSREELNTHPHPYKMCPSYILPHWDAFEERVWAYYDQMLATIAAA